jgi:hypothetical protein
VHLVPAQDWGINMSWNNVIPAKMLIDQMNQENMNEKDYIDWLKKEVADWHDSYFIRRLYIMEHPEEFEK